MHVKGKADVKVEITPKELISALKEEVYSTLNLPNPRQGRVYVKEGRWVLEKTVHTSHSFQIEEDMGLAIDEDVEVFTALHTIAEFLKD